MKIFCISHFLFFAFLLHAQDTWVRKADFGGIKRAMAVGFSIGSKGYIGTGVDSTSPGFKNDFWEYDPSLDSWTQKANFIGTPRINAAGFAIGAKGYIGTGADISSCLIDFYEWDQASNTWTQKTNFPGNPRGDAIGFSIGTKGYIATGANCLSPPNFAFYNDLWEWDQASDTWVQKANFSGNKRQGAIGFSIGTKGYIGTGYSGSSYDDFWEWDQTSNSWSQKATFPGVSRWEAVGFSIGTIGYIGTGYDGSNDLNDFWAWNQITNTWTQRANFSGVQRNEAVGFSIGDKGYIGTGSSSSVAAYFNDFWEWDPNGVGVNEIDLKNSVSVYPNPSNGNFQVTINNSGINKFDLEIYTMQGEKVYAVPVSVFPVKVDLTNQPAGVYFLQLKTDKGSVVKKVVKE